MDRYVNGSVRDLREAEAESNIARRGGRDKREVIAINIVQTSIIPFKRMSLFLGMQSPASSLTNSSPAEHKSAHRKRMHASKYKKMHAKQRRMHWAVVRP